MPTSLSFSRCFLAASCFMVSIMIYVDSNHAVLRTVGSVSCVELRTTPLQQLGLNHTSTSSIWRDGDPTNTSTCEFQLQDAFNFHFPHTLQQLYRCWSLWRDAPDPALVFPRQTLPDNHFIQGYIVTLQDAIGLNVLRRSDTATAAVPLVPPNAISADTFFRLPSPPYYAWSRPDDARALRDVIASSLGLSSRVGSSSVSCNGAPRIAVLNRHRTRELANVPDIVQALGGPSAASIHYFDSNTSFRDQIDFYYSHDIVISPHGAQLTGLPFLPNCGAVLEIFPAGYYLPHFFGSLAAAAQIQHGFLLATKSGDWVAEVQAGMYNSTTRNRVRNNTKKRPFCIAPTAIRSAVDQLVQQRNECCSALQQ